MRLSSEIWLWTAWVGQCEMCQGGVNDFYIKWVSHYFFAYNIFSKYYIIREFIWLHQTFLRLFTSSSNCQYLMRSFTRLHQACLKNMIVSNTWAWHCELYVRVVYCTAIDEPILVRLMNFSLVLMDWWISFKPIRFITRQEDLFLLHIIPYIVHRKMLTKWQIKCT